MTAAAIILAAGEGTRMKSDLPKVAHAILGVPMIRLVIDTAREAGCDPIVVVCGHGAEHVEAHLDGVTCAIQDQRLGTGHAAACAEEALGGFSGSVLVLSGDTPLMRAETLRDLVEARESHGAAVCVLTARMADPTGYGRIVRDDSGALTGIVEQKDCDADQAAIDEVNTGTYCFDAGELFAHLHRVGKDNAQGEYYLTDMVEVLRGAGLGTASVLTGDPAETMGVNTRAHLAEAAAVLQRRINTTHMLAGVTMTAPDLVWVGPSVRLGRDVTLEPMTTLLGETVVGDGARVGPQVRATGSRIGAGATVRMAELDGVEVGAGASVGPFAYLRGGTVLAARAKAGTFVEMKNTTVGEGSKVPHLSYMGDATIGGGANVGAGSITCNYDGVEKHATVIGDGAFIGSDTMLVAPVTIGENAVTGAGSAISRDVPAGALGIERAEQRTVEGWTAKHRQGTRDRTEG